MMTSKKPTDANTSVHLNKDFRNLLFGRAYEEAGSLRGIALELGYLSGGGLNGKVREMWKGTQGIVPHRLKKLASLARVPFEEVAKNAVPPEKREVIADWESAYAEFKATQDHK